MAPQELGRTGGDARRYRVDPVRSRFAFRAKAWGLVWVRGRFVRGDGIIVLDGDRMSGVGRVDAATVTTGLRPRDLHLRASDYLAVRRHPTIVLRVDDLAAAGGSGCATLELRGASTEVQLTIDVLDLGEAQLRLRARGQFDRLPLGMRSPWFGVSRFVEIDLDVRALRARTPSPLIEQEAIA